MKWRGNFRGNGRLEQTQKSPREIEFNMFFLLGCALCNNFFNSSMVST